MNEVSTRGPARTAVTLLEITCPPWCCFNGQEHADYLHQMGGDCYHESSTIEVDDDPTEPRLMPIVPMDWTVRLYLQARTDLAGKEVAPAVIYMNQDTEELSLSIHQAIVLADELADLLESYRSAGVTS